jgi:hypothetical protein
VAGPPCTHSGPGAGCGCVQTPAVTDSAAVDGSWTPSPGLHKAVFQRQATLHSHGQWNESTSKRLLQLSAPDLQLSSLVSELSSHDRPKTTINSLAGEGFEGFLAFDLSFCCSSR